MKKYLLIFFALWLLLFFGLNAQMFVNKGSAINVYSGTFINYYGTNFKNDDGGTLNLSGDAKLEIGLTAENVDGTFSLLNSSTITVLEDLYNYENMDILNQNLSIIKVNGNIFNNGYILNEKYLIVGP